MGWAAAKPIDEPRRLHDGFRFTQPILRAAQAGGVAGL